MAKKRSTRGGPNKSTKAEAIRGEIRAQGRNARPRDIIAALKAKGITVSSAQVSYIKSHKAKTKGKRGRKAAGKRGASRADNGMLSMESLLQAKQLIERVGSVDAAKRALDALARLT